MPTGNGQDYEVPNPDNWWAFVGKGLALLLLGFVIASGFRSEVLYWNWISILVSGVVIGIAVRQVTVIGLRARLEVANSKIRFLQNRPTGQIPLKR